MCSCQQEYNIKKVFGVNLFPENNKMSLNGSKNHFHNTNTNLQMHVMFSDNTEICKL